MSCEYLRASSIVQDMRSVFWLPLLSDGRTTREEGYFTREKDALCHGDTYVDQSPRVPPADALTVEGLIDAYLQLISRAHVHVVKLIGDTISPFKRCGLFLATTRNPQEATRQAVNKW